MKLPLIAFAGVVITGGIIGMSLYNGDDQPETKAENIEEVSAETTVETTNTVEAPLKRTVETHGGYPWQYYGAEQIIEGQKNGEVYYLFSDAEEFENTIIDFAVSEELEGAPITKVDNGISFAQYLQGFIEGTQKHQPEQKDYFLKLVEVENDLKTGNFDVIPDKIKEAKTLRNN